MDDKDVLDDIDDLLNDDGDEMEMDIDIHPIIKRDLSLEPISRDGETGEITMFIARRVVYAIKIVPLDYLGSASDFFIEEERERQVSRVLAALGIEREKYIVRRGDQWRIRLSWKEDVTAMVISRFVDGKIDGIGNIPSRT